MHFYFRFLLTVFLLAASIAANACSCGQPPNNFDDYLGDGTSGSPEDSVQVVRGRILTYYSSTESSQGNYPLKVDFLILEYMRGSLAFTGDTISFIGQDGLNCGYDIGSLPAGDEFIIMFYGLVEDVDCIGCPTGQFLETILPGCGPSVLAVNEGVVSGSITWDANEMALDDFRNRLEGYVRTVANRSVLALPALKIYPVPVTDVINLSWAVATVAEMTLFDNQGRAVASEKSLSGQLSGALNVSYLPSGVYYLRLSSGPQALVRKVVIR